ncbi:Transcription forms complexes with DNA-binding s Swi4p and Mbp1p [Chlorella sorokiniana]|uniref:Transcription forms complexes with DNA-binding s Swi4p and Mbp1p n=1 Tax=Chlorella sorokiniana TaxID=3076 RepID=A0A2P6TWP5_CHLSO|nr:Transcription forms complexes with DNA-binding s Swi4p and Mbp1p [Chlorella sorokiniana]|eukprot:PRW58477.1 Transcription forms complexes with DNA-binding s Swi4p and Mbp1p [Chlorella sorokiniana]
MDNTSDAALCRRLDVLEELFSRPRIRELALAPSQDGRTFLFYMAQWGGLPMRRCEVFDAVIQAAQELGMDVNHQDPNGDTVLHVAMRAVARRGLDDKEFIQRWIWAGARPSIPNASGLRAFDVLGDPARRKCHFSLNALHYGEMQEAAPPRETRGQRYVRRHGAAQRQASSQTAA